MPEVVLSYTEATPLASTWKLTRKCQLKEFYKFMFSSSGQLITRRHGLREFCDCVRFKL